MSESESLDLTFPVPETSDSMNAVSASEQSFQVADLVRRFGTSSSVALLDPSCKIFSTPGVEGIIGYRSKLGCAIVFGNPVCAPENTLQLVQAFHHFCQSQNLKVVYAASSPLFAEWAIKHTCHALVEFGEELILDPQRNPLTGSQGRKLRTKVNQAVHLDVIVDEYCLKNEKLEKDIDQVAQAWLKGRQGPQIFLAEVNLFAEKNGKRWFYAKRKDEIVGILLLNQIESCNGWVLNLLMTIPDAPPSTSELLVVSALQTLRDEGCGYLSIGTFPSQQLGKIIGIGSLSTWIARRAFKIVKRIFRLDGKMKYWKKFQPNSQGCFLLFLHPRLGIREMLGIIRALNASF